MARRQTLPVEAGPADDEVDVALVVMVDDTELVDREDEDEEKDEDL